MTARSAPAMRVPAAGRRAGWLAQALARLGLVRDWDFLLHLPLRYEDETRIQAIAALVPGSEAQVEAVVRDVRVHGRGRRDLRLRVSDDSGEMQLRWVHFYATQLEQWQPGRRVRAWGAVRRIAGGIEMVHPRLRLVEEGEPVPQALTPVYPAAQGVSQAVLRRRIARALERTTVVDTVPPDARRKLGLIDLALALRQLHAPTQRAPGDVDTALAPAQARLRFDELLAQQLALRRARALRRHDQAPALEGAGAPLSAGLRAILPFTLTADQEQVWQEIAQDLQATAPMNRLLQGDVGSGKTVVAALAAVRAVESGFQAALMAPTEILAAQHVQRIAPWLESLGVAVLSLSARTPEAQRRALQVRIEAGEACVVVGTHALIQTPVRFGRLGLAIVDEQHRFGVAQRLALRQGERVPHLLMLSATPIPRSLAMSYFSDLDVSVIRSLPPGRQPVRTKLIAGSRRHEVLAAIRAEVAQGRQAYWVCPLVEESDEIGATAAVRMVEETRALLPELRVALLHGQMPGEEKRLAMQEFAAGRVDVLVATTVVEVGVDVPNASLMVVEHAQRFGLATLHQLRGRVGRGAAASACVLLFDEPLSDTARERLRVLYETNDGFEIARRDLRLRGPGEILGARQSGLPMLRYADLERDAGWLDAARELADRLLASDARAADALVERWFPQAQGFLQA